MDSRLAGKKYNTPVKRLLRVLPPPLRRQIILRTLHKFGLLETSQPFMFNGNARAWVDMRDAEGRAHYIQEYFWPDFMPMVSSFLRSGGDMFDIGANYGLVSFGVLPHLVGVDTKFHLFEANPLLIPQLEKSIAEYPEREFKLVQACVSDVPGTSFHALPDKHWGQGTIASEGQPVPNILLDDYIRDAGVERIAFMKVDVEGWEIHVLRGGKASFAAGKVQAGYVELEPEHLGRAGFTTTDVLDLLQSSGFYPCFAGLWDWEYPDPYHRVWKPVDINGTMLRVARALPLPPGYRGDVLITHPTSPHYAAIRAALGEG